MKRTKAERKKQRLERQESKRTRKYMILMGAVAISTAIQEALLVLWILAGIVYGIIKFIKLVTVEDNYTLRGILQRLEKCKLDENYAENREEDLWNQLENKRLEVIANLKNLSNKEIEEYKSLDWEIQSEVIIEKDFREGFGDDPENLWSLPAHERDLILESKRLARERWKEASNASLERSKEKANRNYLLSLD